MERLSSIDLGSARRFEVFAIESDSKLRRTVNLPHPIVSVYNPCLDVTRGSDVTLNKYLRMAVQKTTTSLYVLDKISTAKGLLRDVSFAAS